MNNNPNLNSIYFIGIGGIGMSSLARYYLQKGFSVGGYDKTKSKLTEMLTEEGAWIHYEDNYLEIPSRFKNQNKTLIVYTPAIPNSLGELIFFKNGRFKILKRAELLGEISRMQKSLCVAGTHGKTTTTSMLAHILNNSNVKCNAFLGGISTNLNSNVLINENAIYSIVEADEFDRSFLKLSPYSTIITSYDADHLDIYGDQESFQEGFKQYSMKSSPNGFLIQKEGLNLPSLSKTFTYAIESSTADYSVEFIRFEDGAMFVDMRMKNQIWRNVEVGLPGIHNAENALACAALLINLDINEIEIRNGLRSFLGVKRRFEYLIKSEKLIYIDDYAHHPSEIKMLIDSVKLLYPQKVIRAIFQPHLFTRTRDFSTEFANELSKCDEVILMPIYPAREESIHGITSEWLLQKIKCSKKSVKLPSEVISHFKNVNEDIVLTIGAGDIDLIVNPLKQILVENI